jgi:hypothetical protein
MYSLKSSKGSSKSSDIQIFPDRQPFVSCIVILRGFDAGAEGVNGIPLWLIIPDMSMLKALDGVVPMAWQMFSNWILVASSMRVEI